MDEEYLEAVLDLVTAIPAGRVMTYGSIAEVLHDRLGRGGPRQVGQVLSRAGGDVPWWRVVNASGQPPAPYRTRALAALRSEGCPLDDGGPGGGVDDGGPGAARVALRRALWWPDLSAGPAAS